MPLVDLAGLAVAVDVQHLYRRSKPRDQGCDFVLPDGTHISEAHATAIYAGALTATLRGLGARVLTNDPASGILIGEYWERGRAAAAWGAQAYIACHLDAGRGSYALAEAMTGSQGIPLAQRLVNMLPVRFPSILASSVRVLERPARGVVCIEAFSPHGAAVICEPFFGDNPAMAGLFQSPELARIGEALALGVASWWIATRRS
jgi:N-acetylmuramoyl-L-alanine amidase